MPSAARDTVINVAEMGHAVLHRDQSEGWWKGQAAGGCRRQQRHHGSGAGGHSASQFLLQESLIRSLATGQSLIRISAGGYSTSFSDQNLGWWLLCLFLWSKLARGYSTSFSNQNFGWWLLYLFLWSEFRLVTTLPLSASGVSDQNFGWWLPYIPLAASEIWLAAVKISPHPAPLPVQSLGTVKWILFFRRAWVVSHYYLVSSFVFPTDILPDWNNCLFWLNGWLT